MQEMLAVLVMYTSGQDAYVVGNGHLQSECRISWDLLPGNLMVILYVLVHHCERHVERTLNGY